MIALLKLGSLAIAVLMVMGLGLGGGHVSAESLPGDPLYGLKLAAEQVRLALAADAGDRADLSLAAAEARMRETTQLLQQNRLVDEETVARTRQQLEATLQAALRLNDSEAAGSLQRLAVSVQQHQRTMTAAAGEAPEPPLRQLLREMERVRLEAHAGAQDPEGLRIRLRQGTPPTPPEQPEAGQPPAQEMPGAHPPQDPGPEDQPMPVRVGPRLPERPGQDQEPQPGEGPQRTRELRGTQEHRDPDLYPPFGPAELPGAGGSGDPEGQGQTEQNSRGGSGQDSDGAKNGDDNDRQGAPESPGGGSDGESQNNGQGSQPDDTGEGQPPDMGNGEGGDQGPGHDGGNAGEDESPEDSDRGGEDDGGNGGGDPPTDAGSGSGDSNGGNGSDSGNGK